MSAVRAREARATGAVGLTACQGAGRQRAHSSSNVKASIQSYGRLFPALILWEPKRMMLGAAAGLWDAQASFCTRADKGQGMRLCMDNFSHQQPRSHC